MQRLPASARASSAWKNGGGRTWEIAAAPAGAGLDDFDWRVSIARVESGGPFSRFEGIDRTLLVLEGELSLRIADARHRLGPAGAAVRFAGEAPVAARAPGRPVTDLNVMTRRGRYESSVRRCSGLPAYAPQGEVAAIILALEDLALEDLALRSAAKAERLQRFDAVRLRPGQPVRCPAGRLVLIELWSAGRAPDEVVAAPSRQAHDGLEAVAPARDR